MNRARVRRGVRLLLVSVCALVAVPRAPHGAPRESVNRPPTSGFPQSSGYAVHDDPVFETRWHDVGTIWMELTNAGQIGFTSYSNVPYISNVGAGMFFGCVRGLDTLVSEGCNQRWPHYNWRTPEFVSYTPIREISHRRSSEFFHPAATADQQFTTEFTDTTRLTFAYGLSPDEIDLRPHRPIGIAVRMASYAWSNPFSRRFVLMDYCITNISGRIISKPVVAFYSDPDVVTYGEIGDTITKYQLDDISGFIPTVPGAVAGTLDTVNMAWVADNDGDPYPDYTWRPHSARAVIGTRILRAPEGAPFQYNWFANNHQQIEWGPRRQSNAWTYLNSQGAPFGDRARYRVMTNGEIDYDQMYAVIDMTGQGWQPPARGIVASELARGIDTRFILSFGPFADMMPGDSVFFTVAVIMGDNFHRDPLNFFRNFDEQDPSLYRSRLNFRQLIDASRWAEWVYDNPGVDTDGNGYRGRAHLVNCRGSNCDSIFYQGDGVPDFRGPGPPPTPAIDMTTQPGRVILRWNGDFTELERDPISQKRDFEGYRLYSGRFARDDQFSLIASWDLVDYKRIAYSPTLNEWGQISDPALEEDWPDIMGDPDFSPLDYPAPDFAHAYQDSVPDTVFTPEGDIVSIGSRVRYSYWTTEDWNRGNEYVSEYGTERNIIQRVALRDTMIGTTPYTYGVYEATIENLNPAVPLFFAITTFDFGDFSKGMDPMESGPSENYLDAHPIYSSDVVIDSGLRVYVYPNPYKAIYPDAWGNPTTYYREGYEGRGINKFEEQDRRIHFINLPDTATIRIYTLDGDLIRVIHHPDPFLTTYSSEVGWDLVSRNVQAVVSGLYIWRVDSRLGTQMGKLVIIK